MHSFHKQLCRVPVLEEFRVWEVKIKTKLGSPDRALTQDGMLCVRARQFLILTCQCFLWCRGKIPFPYFLLKYFLYLEPKKYF